MPAPRSDAAVVATDTEIYLFGGMRDFHAFDDALVFRNGTWHAVPEAKLPETRIYAGGASDGAHLYVAGGMRTANQYQTGSTALWEFDLQKPSAGWKALPPIPGDPRFNFAMVADKGSLWVFGGASGAGDQDVRNLADAYRLELKTGKWTRLKDLPEPNRAMPAAQAGAELVVLGGFTNRYEDRTWVYTPQSDTWREGARMPHGVADGRAAKTGNLITVVTGEAGSGIRAPWTMTAEADSRLADLEYVRAAGKPLLLDLYLPAAETRGEKPLPVILSIHGGGWHGGSKEASPGLEFTRRGYAVASLNYRLTGEAEFPAQIDDCKAAVRWLRANAGRYGLDPTRIAAWGASAGGHLAALLGTSGEGPTRIQAVVDFFGPIDVVLWARSKGGTSSGLLHGPLTETAERLKAANPLTFVKPGAPPFLIAHGAEDTLVPMAQSQLLYDGLKQAGVPADLRIIQGAAHSVKQMNLDDDVDKFLKAAFGQ
ncbi:MAG: alpha/beta hydrolase fold domain-containing protein [Acidobacteria bacterium]|nr:alpha/beta hydrolase fold domain-containing protein [Acidobacteriota bacterium]